MASRWKFLKKPFETGFVAREEGVCGLKYKSSVRHSNVEFVPEVV